MFNIGLQLWTVKEETEKDFEGTLRKLAQMGYPGVEFAGFYQASSLCLKELLQETGLKPAGSHTPLEELIQKLEEVLDYNRGIGNKLIVLPWLPEQKRKTAVAYKETASLLNEIGQKCRENGFMFAYHNHDFEFQRYGEGTGLDILLKHTSPENVKFELDSYWAVYAGVDPIALMREHPGRFISLHLKDMKIGDGEKRSTELGTGTIDIKSLITAGMEQEIDWYIIEQEQFEQSPVDSCKQSLQFILDLKKELLTSLIDHA
ncbi:sugar phosphate isomerase/epimerase family protein [Peribacillus kribbensis]|uniref:sugar phosphate isomerase/epimerase family protein n=1 Tax=Peribacillus kribbensis TaxID=356658 RepID=UPI0003FD1C32|nr:sugar phosphate isomerase/epimerase [Peribacillus kribbensis]